MVCHYLISKFNELLKLLDKQQFRVLNDVEVMRKNQLIKTIRTSLNNNSQPSSEAQK